MNWHLMVLVAAWGLFALGVLGVLRSIGSWYYFEMTKSGKMEHALMRMRGVSIEHYYLGRHSTILAIGAILLIGLYF